MLSSVFYKVINIIFNGVSVSAIIILSITVLISTFNTYVRSLSLF